MPFPCENCTKMGSTLFTRICEETGGAPTIVTLKDGQLFCPEQDPKKE